MKTYLTQCGVLCLLLSALASADDRVVDHHDELTTDSTLTLAQVVDAAFDKYPDSILVAAYEDEARALDRRTASWIAGYPMLYLQWIDDRTFDSRGRVEVQTGYQVPLWLWNQRQASGAMAREARKHTDQFAKALRHEVAGQVREVLWNLKLVENRHRLAEKIYEVASKLTDVVRRRVELGDLARADLLLAEADQLEKKTALIQAEAEVMHARKAYFNITRLTHVPERFDESPSTIKQIEPEHPAMASANGLIERAHAEVDYVRHSKQGNQPTILLGTQHDRSTRRENFGTETNLVFQLPIGGDAYNGPFVAAANVTLNRAIAQRETLARELEKALHEADHNLEVDQAALDIATRRKVIAETQLTMNRLAFDAGEISLIDYLRITASAEAAIRDAAEWRIRVQRDIAVHNQVIGVSP
ncbi:MAG: TolC family protein [Methylococcaceae bacterium]